MPAPGGTPATLPRPPLPHRNLKSPRGPALAPPGPGIPPGPGQADPRPRRPPLPARELRVVSAPARPFPRPARQRGPPGAMRLRPAPRPCPAYPPARRFRCAGGGQAGRRGRLWSPRPWHVLPAQGPPGAGPLPVVIPGRAQTAARARAPCCPAPPRAARPSRS